VALEPLTADGSGPRSGGREDHAGGWGGAADEPQLGDVVVLLEQALARAEDERVDHQQVLVDQSMREQRTD